ncbi:uncharacterized protein [Oryza sativa Japonica Group]|jgi:hypothetical protein|uniref:Expressed protein n=6 Tax=Oryza TaxID=4527 RepID=Q2QXF9_ORYSJ|nr:uncharacterized protein LOC4351554 [Oryza sativa Japonica Group]KAB8116672.1 hypothetical protein EE612_057912 [Oryza sativa]ABA96514.1 expressed protein [Oryza sativa Japonica Group]KAF2906753.1 hypothetical protein DAI22_12g044300 [Oryza sativa Japonica Group]BAF29224.2 Os12g0158700 [Oryza sativa Japonica Group]BAH00879.1 unnamed protein product [Oryza sativa Japonica Group]|eukprot:NP_001066205.2 Os12g0158700 [Oryza sativa Japonica Group]
MPAAAAAAATGMTESSSPSSSPSPPRKFRRVRSPLANGGAAGDFELRHWRTPPKRARSSAAPPWAPPEIEIPCGGGEAAGRGGGYTSLRDILMSPGYAASCSPAACGGGGGGGSCGDIHMIRHPLVKHAAYAYLQMTPSARDDPGRRHRRRWRGPLCRLLLGCLSFIGALFRP